MSIEFGGSEMCVCVFSFFVFLSCPVPVVCPLEPPSSDDLGQGDGTGFFCFSFVVCCHCCLLGMYLLLHLDRIRGVSAGRNSRM